MKRKLWYLENGEDVATAFGVDVKVGLTNAEAAKRLAVNGENKLTGKKRRSLILVFLSQFCDFMVMVLLAAAIISAAFGEMLDAMMIVAIIVLNGILGFVQEYKAEKSLEALKELYVDKTLVMREGKKQKLNSVEVVTGDIILLNQGDKIPADIRLIETSDLQTEESILTGESRPISKVTNTLEKQCPLAERKNICYSGTTILRGRGMGIAIATAMDTEMGKIAELLDDAKITATPLQKRLNSLGKWLITICVVVCAMVSVAGILGGGDVYTMVLTGVSLGVASIPEGLPAIVTICLALGVWRLAKGRSIVKKLPAVETLGSTTIICTDKTGTLTENTMKVQSLYVDDAWQRLSDIQSSSTGVKESLKVMQCCNSLNNVDGKISGDATELALFQGAEAVMGEALNPCTLKTEISFTAERRMMSVLLADTSYIKGAPDTLLKLCTSYYKGNSKIPIGFGDKDRILHQAREFSQSGLRVLAMAKRSNVTKKAQMEVDLTFLSLVAIEDPIREDAYEAISMAQKAGIRIAMITGDDKGTALSVGRSLGIAKKDDDVILGKDLPADVKQWDSVGTKTIFARVAPEDKMKLVRYYKGKNEVVAMTGDGVNDAPALKEADIGIAMGKRGADVTKEAADFVLTDDNFASIVEAVFQGRGIYDNIRKFIRYLLSSNLGEVLTMFLAVAFGFPLPLLPLQILWINLVTDGLPALALGMDKPDKSLMEQAPRHIGESLFSHGLGKKIFLRGALIGITTIGVFLYAVVTYGTIDIARTMAFTTLVFCQLFYVFDCRSEIKSHFTLGLLSNPWLLGAVGLSVMMQCFAIYLPWCQQIFHTVSLNMEQWILILFVTVAPSFFSYFYYLIRKMKFFPKKAGKVI